MILLFLLRFAGQLFGPIISILESGIVNPVTLVKLNVVTLLMSYKYTHTPKATPKYSKLLSLLTQ